MQLSALVTAVTVATAVSAAPQEISMARDLLSPADRESIRVGRVVAKVINTDDRSEILCVSAFQAPVDSLRFLEYARSPGRFHRPENTLGAGRIGNPPSAADFAALGLEDGELQGLERCRLGSCIVRLTAEEIERFRSGVDWSSPERRQVAEAVFRGILAREAAAYLAHGDSGLAPYRDGPNGTYRAAGLGELLRRPLSVLDRSAELRDHLRSFASGFGSPFIDEYLAWHKDRFWRKPVVSLYHMVLWKAESALERRVVVAAKQIYASHFFESSVEFLELTQPAGQPAATVVFVKRARADVRPSGFSWLERLLLRGLVKSRLQDEFEALRTRLGGRADVQNRQVLPQ